MVPLNSDETNYFEDLYWQRSQPIRQRFEAELRKVDDSTEVNKSPDYLNLIKEYAQADIEVRVTAHADTYRRFAKYPTEQDFSAFIDQLKRETVPRFTLEYSERYTGLASTLPQDLVQRNLEILSEDIGVTKVGEAASKHLRVLVNEGKIRQ